MDRTGGPNRHSRDYSSGKRSAQNQYSSQNSSHSMDLGWKSADNLCSLNSDGNKNIKVCSDEVEGIEASTVKKGQQQLLSVSVSTSPYLEGTHLSNTSPSPLGTEGQPHFPENSTLSANSSESYHSTDGKNSPTHISVFSALENGENKQSLSQSFTPSPQLSPRLLNIHATGDSSDEKGDKFDTSKLSISREGSFDRSVSFQEGVVEQDKLSEVFRTSDVSRSLESSRPLDLSRQLDSSATHSQASSGKEKERKESREGKSGEKDKKNKKSWYNVLSPTYKSRSEDLKRLFKDLPSDERLIVDYSCALQKDILVHGRLYITPNFFSFYSKIFGWETFLSIRCKDIVAMTKEKTALVIPNALQVNTDSEKHFFTSFTARDKTYLMLFRIWQNALMDQQMSTSELWHWVHSSYGEELGLTSDDDDYVAPSTEDDMKSSCYSSAPYEALHDGTATLLPKVTKRNSIDSTEDASQGESNVEDGIQPPRLPLHISSHTSGSSKSSSIAPSKPPSCSTPSSTTSRPPYQLLPPTEQHNQELPTDQSDTAESDQDKEKEKSPEIIVCPNIASHHIGREVSNAVYGLPIDTLFTLLFTNSKFMLDLHTARKTYDVVASPWQSNPDTNQKIRQVTYTLTLPTNSFGPKVSHVTETQVISSFSKPSEIYTVDAEASNSGIPYADSFYVSNHWCLTRESATETRLVVWSQVKYKKNVWGFMKSVIDKNACSGMEGLISDLNASLILEVDRTNLKKTKRRRRRAGSKGSDPGDPILQLPSPGIKLNEINKPTQIPSRKMKTEIPPVNSSIKSLALLILCTLMAVNAFLYYRLYDLEERIVNNVSFKSQGLDASLLKLSASSGEEVLAEEWVRILHQQEALHAQELERWRKAVMEAADYLKKAEESLRNLHASIPNKQASKMQALLQQLQLLKQMQEQKSSPPPPKSPLFSLGEGPSLGKMGEPPPKEKLEL